MRVWPTYQERYGERGILRYHYERLVAELALVDALRALRALWASRPAAPPRRSPTPPVTHVDALARERRALRALGDGQAWHVDLGHDVSRSAALAEDEQTLLAEDLDDADHS